MKNSYKQEKCFLQHWLNFGHLSLKHSNIFMFLGICISELGLQITSDVELK